MMLVVLLLLPIYGFASGKCNGDIAFDVPNADIPTEYDPTTGSVTVSHEEGDTLRAEWTDALYILVKAGDSGNSTTYPLANTADAFPVIPGDQFTRSNVTVDDRALSSGDTISVVWRGSEPSPPIYCLNSRENTTGSMTLDKQVIQ